jgi:type II secretory pathway pseudopilin PulG
MTFNKQHIQGWTLVEVAIVIIIVGLLLGGVLKGRAMITNARIKNLESSYENIAKAIYTYQERYHNLPGDDNRAGELFEHVTNEQGNPIISNGDANGKIEGNETGQAWQHLRAAQLIVGSPYPDDAGNIIVPINAFGGNTEIGYKEEFRANSISFTRIPKEIADILDEKKDDGIEEKGRMRRQNGDDDLFNIFFLL